MQISLSDEENRLEKITKLGDSLEHLKTIRLYEEMQSKSEAGKELFEQFNAVTAGKSYIDSNHILLLYHTQYNLSIIFFCFFPAFNVAAASFSVSLLPTSSYKSSAAA